ncbi:MAG: membrane protein insertion efficiency factor YidD [Planctomycetota bacterium]
MPSAIVRSALVGLIWLYRLTLSPLIGGQCRHIPTCSEHAIRVVHERGPWVGSMLAARRVLSCHPFSTPKCDSATPERPESDEPTDSGVRGHANTSPHPSGYHAEPHPESQPA